MRLNAKFSLTVGMTALATAAVLGSLIYSRVHDVLQVRAVNAQLTAAHHILRDINTTLSSAQRDLLVISADEFLKTYVENPHYRTPENKAKLKRELQERTEITGPWTGLEIFDLKHQSLFSIAVSHPLPAWLLNSPAAKIAFRTALQGKTYVSNALYAPRNSTTTLLFSAPIHEATTNGQKGPVKGVLLAQYRCSALSKILSAGFQNGHVYLFDQTGQLVSAYASGMPDSATDIEHHTTFQKALLNSRTHVGVQFVQHGAHYMLSTHVQDAANDNQLTRGWGLAIEQSEATVFAPARQLAFQTVVIIIFAMSLLAGVLILFGYRLTVPLRRFVHITKRIGQGHFKNRLNWTGNDEVAELASSFKTMAEQLEARQSELLAAKNRIQGIVDTVPGLLYVADPGNFRTIYVSPAVETLLGVSASEYIEDSELWEKMLLAEDREQTFTELDRAKRCKADFVLTYRMRRHDGKSTLWIEDRGSWEKDSSGNIVALHGVMTDITDRKKHEADLIRTGRALDALHRLDVLLTRAATENELTQGVCDVMTDEQIYQFAWVGLLDGEESAPLTIISRADADPVLDAQIRAANITVSNNCLPCRVMRDKQPHLIQNLKQNPSPDDLSLQAFSLDYAALISLPLTNEGSIIGSLNLYSKNANVFDQEELTLLKEIANNLAYGIAAIRLQVRHAQAQDELAYRALHDALTDLPNRANLTNLLQLAITHAERSNAVFAVLFVDLDDFKLVNDTLGHHAGDDMLRQVGERIGSCVRSGDVVARQGGDEFIVLMTDTSTLSGDPDTSQVTRLLNPARQAQRLIERLREPFVIEGQIIYSGASIGIAVWPHDTPDADALLRYADIAMYRAKELGKGRYAFYSEELTERQNARVSMVSRMHAALERNEFRLHYQPIIELSTGACKGVEALLRWQDGDGNVIPPGDFLPIAEDMGLIVPIGRWVLEEACRQINVWSEEGLELLVAINVSARQLWHEDVAEVIMATLANAGVSHSAIELEITETALSHDPQHMEAALQRFAEAGLKISLDDFGTGYSSLSRLKQLPIDTLKIDKSFVDGIPHDGNSTAIVVATMQLAHNLGMRSLAEGIETEDQADWLRQRGCQYGQGYYFSRPIPAADVSTFIARSNNLSEE
ncbi:MAG: EAL domain-containing protein [Acidihalobacter sp.]|uniref:EAL domain-containing protein n=1 Tax=Acidihalobacter sp. TaxID=1872108 RepID=UPI00307F00F8